MKKLFIFSLVLVLCLSCQNSAKQNIERPKLVVGIVIDQMRWDYLYRYYDRYGDEGFKRLLNGGFSCENTMLNYIPTYTAVGHASIYSGSVPSINGIAGNDFIHQKTGKWVNCVKDTTCFAVGIDGNAKAGKCSPRNLLATTITDELKLATDFRSKVIGIALKDRASILPAGHAADAAYWFNDSAKQWLTSTFYTKELPEWLKNHNKQNFPENVFGTPYGNTMTFEMARLAIENEGLGKNSVTDFLALSCSSPDYIGHQFGINSQEIETCYTSLDKELADFFKFLDKKIGKNNYLLFLTADHACAHNAQFLIDHNINSDIFNDAKILKNLNDYLKKIFGKDNIVMSLNNYQVNFDYKNIDKIPREKLIANCIEFLEKEPSVQYVVEQQKVAQASVPQAVKERIINGYHREYSGEIQIIVKPAYYHADNYFGSTHGTWNPYDSHIPLIFYGWGIKKGSTCREVYITDIAPTLAALLKIQMPNGCIGKPIMY